MEFLVEQLLARGFIVLEDAVAATDASLLRALADGRAQGRPVVVVFKQSDVQGAAAVAPLLYLATGMMSVYQVVDAAGTRTVQVPQLVQQPNATLAPGAFESFCQKLFA
jgi:nucleotidyltransferase/DNA polymerase involved in DNA repair